MKKYYANVKLRGTLPVEGSRCPSDWRGSGVYDVSGTVYQEVEVIIVAEDLEAAEIIAHEHDYGDCGMEDVNDVSVLSIEYQSEYDGTESGIIEKDYSYVEGPEDDGPDPDYEYELRRDR